MTRQRFSSLQSCMISLNSLAGRRSNDLDKINFKTALKLTTEFIKLNSHTDTIVISVPHHHDLHSPTYVNNEI